MSRDKHDSTSTIIQLAKISLPFSLKLKFRLTKHFSSLTRKLSHGYSCAAANVLAAALAGVLFALSSLWIN